MAAVAGTIGHHGCQQQQDRQNQTVGKSARVEKIAAFSRDTWNSSRNSQLQHQQHPDINSRRETRNKRDARNSRDANNSTSNCRDANSTVKTPTTHGVSQKTRQNGEKFVKKDTKRVNISNFGPIDFTQSDSYWTIRSPMLRAG
jgi:hypothetical protein